MTDRLKGFTVTLADNIRADDAEPIRQAILQLKGVIDVAPSVDSADDHINRMRVGREFLEKLMDLWKDSFRPEKP